MAGSSWRTESSSSTPCWVVGTGSPPATSSRGTPRCWWRPVARARCPCCWPSWSGWASGAEDLAGVVVTHIHLDHAGGVGDVARAFPKATVYVHEKGARHLVDPTRLVDSASRVYGPLLDSLYGRLDPTPADRIHVLADLEEIRVSSNRSLVTVDSPGHAKHHLALHDTLSGVLFAGDAVGVKLPDAGVLRPSTPPPDFDLDQALHSLAAVRRPSPDRIGPGPLRSAGRSAGRTGRGGRDPPELGGRWPSRPSERGEDIAAALEVAFASDLDGRTRRASPEARRHERGALQRRRSATLAVRSPPRHRPSPGGGVTAPRGRGPDADAGGGSVDAGLGGSWSGMNISIVAGWLPFVVRVVAVVLLVASVDWWSGGWKRQLGRGLPLAAVVTGLVALVATVWSLTPSDFPWSAYVWGFTFLLAWVVAVTGWRSAGRWRRASMVAADHRHLAGHLGCHRSAVGLVSHPGATGDPQPRECGRNPAAGPDPGAGGLDGKVARPGSAHRSRHSAHRIALRHPAGLRVSPTGLVRQGDSVVAHTGTPAR